MVDQDALNGSIPRQSRILSVSQLKSGFVRRWKLFAAITLLVTALVLAATLMLKPAWTAETQLRIEPNQRNATDIAAAASGTPPDQAIVDTEVNLMRSREVLREVATNLDLVGDPEFAGDDGKPRSRAQMIEATVDGLLRKLQVSRQGSTYLVTIAMTSADRTKAVEIANAVANAYLRFSAQGRVSTATEQSEQLRSQLQKLGNDVKQADAAVAQYRASQGIVQGSAAGSITEQQIAPLSTQLAEAESEAAAASAKVAAARSQIARGGIDAVSDVLNSSVIADLRRQRAEVLRKRGESSARYGLRHPNTLSLIQQLADLDRQLTEESRRVIGGLESEAQATSARARNLRSQLTRLRSQQASDTRASVTAESLERDAEAKRTVYNQLAQATQQSDQLRQGGTPLGHIVEVAGPPTSPSFPNRPLFALLGLVLGLVAGASCVVLLETMDVTMRSAEEIERELHLPFVASVPRLTSRQLQAGGGNKAPWDYLVDKPMSAFAEALRTIRGSLADEGGRPRIVAVCSALPAEGKTSVSVGLGRVMAMAGDRVLLIDSDLRRNSLASFVTPSPLGGLVEVLDGTIALHDAIVEDPATGLSVLPLSSSEFNPRDVFSGDALARMLGEARLSYDIVLIDTPPLLAVADARTIAARADVTLLLVRWNSTSRFAVRAAIDRVRRTTAQIHGVVLSNVDQRAGALTASDAAYYTGAYGKYYQN